MVLCREVAFLQAQGNKEQHQHAHKHVKTVKACEQVEGGAKDAGVELEVQVRIQVVVLVTLHAQERDTQQYRHPHETNRFGPLAQPQRMVGNGEGDTRSQQQCGVDGGQPERPHGLKRLNQATRRCRGTRHDAGPHGAKSWPQQ